MKQRPILFSAPMVQAILAGRKTQTRRVVKEKMLQRFDLAAMLGECSPLDAHHPNDQSYFKLFCPYGEVGERLWVREAWRVNSKATDLACVVYRASENDSWTNFHKYFPVELAKNQKASPCGWKPSIHMPRWASRILLEITDVRIERLQDISEADAKAEGATCTLWFEPYGKPDDESTNLSTTAINPVHPSHCQPEGISYRNGFATLWESINGADSWAENPWVWVVEFKVIEGGAA